LKNDRLDELTQQTQQGHSWTRHRTLPACLDATTAFRIFAFLNIPSSRNNVIGFFGCVVDLWQFIVYSIELAQRILQNKRHKNEQLRRRAGTIKANSGAT
jgi:hypothetical protein